MEQHHPLTDEQSRISRNIRIRAERLTRSGAVPGMDADDIAQDLRLDLLERQAKFDPARASFETFADRVITHRIASLAAPTARLRSERTMQDLDAPCGQDGEDGNLSLADILPESAALHAGGDAHPDLAFGLRRDVAWLLSSLTPACRLVAVALSQMSAAEAARALGLHRCTIYARLAAIRAAATAMGLEEYLRPAPTPGLARR